MKGICSATLTGLEPATSAVTGRRGIRTRGAAVKGRCPRPLDDGSASLVATAKNYTEPSTIAQI